MSDSDVVRLTSELVNIKSDSVANGEKEVAKYIHGYLQELGIGSELIEFERGRCNVIAEIGTAGEGFMLNGHMDTVPLGDLKQWKYGTAARVVNGKLYGRGSSDMKGALAAILSALKGADLKNPKRRLVLTFVADEEVSGSGSEWLLKNRKRLFRNVRYGIVAEPTDLQIRLSQKGIVKMSVTTKGKAAHGSRPWLGRNAIVDMSRVIANLETLSKNFAVEDELLGKGTINVGTISGGTATNVVPDSCTIGIDRRIVPGETPKMAVSQIRRVLDSSGIDYEMDVVSERMPYRISRDSYIARFMKSIVPNAEFTGSAGYTEAELYKIRAGIDSVVFGPGTLMAIHKANEYAVVSNLVKGRKNFLDIINRWCSGKSVV